MHFLIVPNLHAHIVAAIHHKLAIITIFIIDGLEIFDLASLGTLDGNALEVKSRDMSANLGEFACVGGASIALPLKTRRAIDGGVRTVVSGHLGEQYGGELKKVKKNLNPAKAAGEG